jgi:hypothetical protein
MENIKQIQNKRKNVDARTLETNVPSDEEINYGRPGSIFNSLGDLALIFYIDAHMPYI